MKSVLRSCFDPLPRSLSTKGLVGLVAVVVLGTGVMVRSYLESAQLAARSKTTAEQALELPVSPSPSVRPAKNATRFTPQINRLDQTQSNQPSASKKRVLADCERPGEPCAPAVFTPPETGT
jgi:hypothetical protein